MKCFLGCVTLISVTVVASAQSPAGLPDLSGHWVFVSQPREPTEPPLVGKPRRATPPRGSYGQEFIAKQDSRTLTIEAKAGPSLVKLIYDLSGAETRQTVLGSLPQTSSVVYQDPMDKSAMVIVTRFVDEKGQPLPGDVKRVLRLSDNVLRVETISTTGKPGEETREVSVYRRDKLSSTADCLPQAACSSKHTQRRIV